MDNAPSGASLISISDGTWEMEARWALKVAMMVGDWKEPLYTLYFKLVSFERGVENIYNIVSISLVNTCPSEWRGFFIFSRNRPFDITCSVFGTFVLGVRIPKILNGCDRSRCKVSAPFIRSLLGLRD